MSFQALNLSSKYGTNTSKPSSRVPLGAAGQGDHQPCWPPASGGQESANKENAPQHEYGVQPSRPIATNVRLRALTSASNNDGTITTTAYSRVSPRKKGKKVARPALLVPSSSPSPSSPTESTTSRPRKLAGKRTSHSNDFGGPSSPPKKARRIEEIGDKISALSHSGLSSRSNSWPITPPPTRDIITSPRPSLKEVRPKTPESVLGRDDDVPIPQLQEQYKIEEKGTRHQSPSVNGDTTHSTTTTGASANRTAATMATRIAEVHKLEDYYNDLMGKLHRVDSVVDSFADDALEDDFAAVKVAFQAWQEAKLRLSSPVPASPTKSTTPASTMSSPALNSVSGEYGDSNMIGIMRDPYLVLSAHLDSTLPKPPVVATNTSDGGVKTIESADAHDEEPTIPDTHPSLLPSEDPQSEGLSPPASSTPPSEPISIQGELPESEGVASASSTPVTEVSTASSSVASAASAPFRFSEDDEALILGHARAKRFTEAADMLPQGQRWRVITTPTEIAAVRLVHPRRTAKPTNKGKRNDSYKSSNRETRSHIEGGAETELWVCRASFKVDEGGVSYLESPCGMPVGTKDSWKRHLKEKHFGRERRK